MTNDEPVEVTERERPSAQQEAKERAWSAYCTRQGGSAPFADDLRVIREAFYAAWKARGEADRAAVMGPSRSGILHDGATARDIALAIAVLDEQ